ncbi:KGK domain-containing protein [Rivularia sp. UHCC 0363]|uniref:KGK domain-containing protein n=1 Tax=Rivularia sp. UHCC 0363 TaxID=3110244 RepID=UPI002B21546F|nr:KGK domain-containing protein [Rivularia sp. UHCC 0363]MEA5598642.1 KGK domain-containing protein [Rivularia sp. UHCC 0363]
MKTKFKPLSCNDGDVLSYKGRLLKFSQFKQQLENELWQKVNYLLTKENDGCHSRERICDLINTSFSSCNISVSLSSSEEGNDCEILRLGANNWQKGKIRNQSSIDFLPNDQGSSKVAKIQFNLEFLPEENEVQQHQLSFDDMMYAA